MLHRLDKYLLSQFFSILMLSLLGFLAVFLVVDLIENLDRFIDNGVPAAANAFSTMSGGPATSEAMTLSASLYSSAARTLHIRLKPLANDLATAATTVTFIIEFQHLAVTPD